MFEDVCRAVHNAGDFLEVGIAWSEAPQRLVLATAFGAYAPLRPGEPVPEGHVVWRAFSEGAPILHLPAADQDSAAVLALPITNAGRTAGALYARSADAEAFDRRTTEILETLAGDVGHALQFIDRFMGAGSEERARFLPASRMKEALIQGVSTLSLVIEKRDPYTSGHQQRVAELAVAIAGRMGLSAEMTEGIRVGALVHDIGKIGVPAEILTKPGRLLPEEFSLVKCHPRIGYEILKDVDFPWPVANIVLWHHERLDGSGYPDGLQGDEVPLETRVVAVADVVESIVSHRLYRPGLGIEAALQEIREKSGRLYDPKVVEACEAVVREGDLPWLPSPKEAA